MPDVARLVPELEVVDLGVTPRKAPNFAPVIEPSLHTNNIHIRIDQPAIQSPVPANLPDSTMQDLIDARLESPVLQDNGLTSQGKITKSADVYLQSSMVAPIHPLEHLNSVPPKFHLK